jgi:hypothetical protein
MGKATFKNSARADAPAKTVPWVNAAMVYGGAMQPLGVKHEAEGHYKLEKNDAS